MSSRETGEQLNLGLEADQKTRRVLLREIDSSYHSGFPSDVISCPMNL